jgi:FkbM family methyltransferase
LPDGKLKESLIRKQNKEYMFKTDFGTFMVFSIDSWDIIKPDYEIEIQKVLFANAKEFKRDKDKIFVDVGAHIGRYAIELSKNYGYNVLAFEPSRKTYNILKVNTILSNVEDKIHLFNFALGDKNATAEFVEVPLREAGNHVKSYTKGAHIKVKNDNLIEVKKFDDLKLDINYNHIKLILIDAESFEYQVVKGMENTLKRLNDIDVVVEILNHVESKSKTMKYLTDLGFRIKAIDDNNFLFYKRS